MKSLITSEIDLNASGKQLGYLRLPHSVHRSAYGFIPMPVGSIKNGKGPRVLLMAGNHGDEYEGQVIVSSLMRELETSDVQGQILFLPMANFPAAKAGLRTSPIDDGNLNRSFPGDPLGTPTQMIAHFITEELLEGGDLLIDLHSGGSSLCYLSSMLMEMTSEDADRDRRIALLDDFGLEYALIYPESSARYADSAARMKGVLSMSTELGGAGMVTPAILNEAKAGVLRALKAQGAYLGAVEAPSHQTRHYEVRGEHYIYAYDIGLFEPLVALGDTVEAGQPGARIHFPETPGRAPVELCFDAPGLVICKRVPARVEPGDCLFHLAAPLS